MSSGLLCRITLGALMLASACVACADERIADFHSEVRVEANSAIDVVETIRILVDGTRIKHGITRTFPTEYHDRLGATVRVGFEFISAERQHAPETWRSEAYENGVRIYLGDADRSVPSGEQLYTLHYRTTRQLGFFEDHDELYWNATGTDWNFPIDNASASVALPGSIAPAQIKLAAYTGAQGAKGRDYRASADAPSHATFQTTAPLRVREGLTIVVGFPKGIVTPPGLIQRATWLFTQNTYIAIGCAGLAFVLIYFLVVWGLVGRDPRAGPIMPQYEAPDGVGPSAMRFVEQRGYDDRCFASDLVDLGVRGALRIEQRDIDYVLTNIAVPPQNTPSVESNLYADLLDGRQELALNQSEQPAIARARSSHSKQLARDFGAANFRTNTGKLWLGGLAALATVYAMDMAANLHIQNNGKDVPVFVLLLLSAFEIGLGIVAIFLALRIGEIWRDHSAGLLGLFQAITGTLVSGVFALLCLILFSLIGSPAGLFGMGLAAALLITVAIFRPLLPAPTVAGRKLLDKIQGLRLYLSVAEGDSLRQMKTPQMTEREFQRFLPYALALDVEKNWTDRFAAAVGPATFASSASAATMGWYATDDRNFGSSNFSSFASSLGNSLSTSIAASATPPGSASGFGSSDGGGSSGGDSGGSSGGGGGGGGGDGW